MSYPALPLRLVMALDRVQKKLSIPDGDLATLRRFGLVEGRIYNLRLSNHLSPSEWEIGPELMRP
jgi:hypothetical protein